MQLSWNPICPACRQRAWSVAFPGDESGAVRPEEHEISTRVKCDNGACGAPIPIDARTAWSRVPLWTPPATREARPAAASPRRRRTHVTHAPAPSGANPVAA